MPLTVLDPIGVGPSLAALLVLGIAAQWVGYRLRIPSIVLLLVLGILAGPVTGLLDPDALLGDLLVPVVSLAVAVILYEGGLTLRFDELRGAGTMLTRLLTIGVGVTFAGAAAAAHLVLGLPLTLAMLLGAILTVTGPTVIGPLLRHVRPTGSSGPLLQWEGIVVDPIGAILAVLVFEAILPGSHSANLLGILLVLLRTILIGGLIGLLAGRFLIEIVARRHVPEYLQPSVSLAIVLGAFTCSNLLQSESGLLTVTVLGIMVANQRRFSIRPMLEFKEHLRVILIAGLFLILAARLKLEDLTSVAVPGAFFVLVLVVVIRPLAVFLSSIGTGLPRADILFVASVAPRGIIAASVASIFALRLQQAGDEQAVALVPAMFVVIIGTVIVYGLAAGPIARWLRLSTTDPQGVLIVGAHQAAREVATAIQQAGIRVVLVDTNRSHVKAARMVLLEAHQGSAHDRALLDRIHLGGIGRMFAMTNNDEVNTLAVLRFGDLFGRHDVYQLAPAASSAGKGRTIPDELLGRVLFSTDATLDHLEELLADGAQIKATRLTERFDFAAWRAYHGKDAVPLFLFKDGRLTPFTVDAKLQPRKGQTLIGIVKLPSTAPSG